MASAEDSGSQVSSGITLTPGPDSCHQWSPGEAPGPYLPEPSRVRQPPRCAPPPPALLRQTPRSSGLHAAPVLRARAPAWTAPLAPHSLLRPFPESERVPKTSGGKFSLLGVPVLRKASLRVPGSLRPGLAPPLAVPACPHCFKEESPKPSRDAPPACLTVVPADGAFQH